MINEVSKFKKLNNIIHIFRKYRSNTTHSEYLVRNAFKVALNPQKDLKKGKSVISFFLGPQDPSVLYNNSIFVESPLLIDVWVEECQILMTFSYFS